MKLERLRSDFEDSGYLDLRQMSDGSWVGILRLLFTWAIVSDLQFHGYSDRWCYKTYHDAKKALDAWDDPDKEPVGWHRHPSTGRRVGEDGRIYINY